jgi:hypothetical protein
MENNDNYIPHFHLIFESLVALYSGAMTISNDLDKIKVRLDKANLFFETLKIFKQAGLFSPVVQNLLFKDIKAAVQFVNEQYLSPNLEQLTYQQRVFSFAASSLCSAFEPK